MAGGFDERLVGLDHLALAVPNVPGLDAWARWLDEHGVPHSGVVASDAGSHLNLRAPDSFPIELFVHAEVRFARDAVLSEEALRTLAARLSFGIEELTYALDGDQLFVYRLVMKTRSHHAMRELASAFGAESSVRRFDISLRRD